MLCPKCGYITFDKYDACPKCKKDWESIKGKLSGTLGSAEPQCFLSRVLKDTVAETGTTAAEDNVNMVSEEEGSVFEGDAADSVDIGMPEAGAALLATDTAEEKDELELALDELPEIDLSGIDMAEAGQQQTETATDEGIELDLDTVAAGVTSEKAMAAEESGGIAFEMPVMEQADTSDAEVALDLSLEASDLEPPMLEGAAVGEEEGSLDLKKIDMSDLIRAGKTKEDAADRDFVTEESGTLELDLDLPDSAEADGDDLTGINLNLDDDESVLDLSLDLDLEPDAPTVKKGVETEPEIPDLGLSLDLDEMDQDN